MRAALPFESFNARALDPAQVARTFVAPSHFENLVKRRHTVLVGPRGSGKTTLLKMLQGAALEAWCSDDAEAFRRRVDYTGVFVPADRAWSQQLGSLGADTLAPEHAALLGRAAFTTHVLLALARAIQYRIRPPDDRRLIPHRRVEVSAPQEAELADLISSAWKASAPVASLAGVILGLTRRLGDTREIGHKESLLPPAMRSERLADHSFLFLGILESVVEGIEAFEQVTGQREGRWALLFDELELAPHWARELLFESMRSVDQRLLFKLSLSPLSRDTPATAFGPAAGHDHDVISLWYPHKEEARPFCRALVASMVKARGLADKGAEDLLGASIFDAWEEPSSVRTQYRRGSPAIRRFRRLAERDRSFAQYLTSHEINLEAPESHTGTERAKLLRKITNIVAVRDAFLQQFGGQGNRARRRSRKNPELYRGASAMFAITEGNPRLLIGIMDRLVGLIKGGKIPGEAQTREARRAAALFEAFLKTIPSPGAGGGPDGGRGVLALIKAIGEQFRDAVIGDAFDPEPPGSFVVDANAAEDLLEGLEQAVNAGALIYVPDKDAELILASIRGKRFRLSYLIAADYQLPLMLMRAVPLSRLIAPRDDSTTHAHVTVETQQRTLFEDDSRHRRR